MGRLTHSEGLRLNKSKNWLSRWQGSLRYSERLHEDLSFEEYVQRLLVGDKFKDSGLIFSHLYISRKRGVVLVHLYVYDGPWNTWKTQGGVGMDDKLGFRLKKLGSVLEVEGNKYFGSKVEIKICGLGSEWITAGVIASYIGIKLKQGYGLEEVLGGIRRNLERNKVIIGYRIDCSGRYSRRQRASKRSLRYGCVPLNSLSAKIEYGFSKVILRYGVCGIKVWLNKKEEKRVGTGYVMKRIKKK